MQEIVAQIADSETGNSWEAEIGDPSSPFKLIVTIVFDQSELGRMRSEVQLIEGNIEEDVITLKEVSEFLQQLDAPFGFLQQDTDVILKRLRSGDGSKEEPNRPDHKYYKMELAVETKLTNMATKLAV